MAVLLVASNRTKNYLCGRVKDAQTLIHPALSGPSVRSEFSIHSFASVMASPKDRTITMCGIQKYVVL